MASKGNPIVRSRALQGHYIRYLKSNDMENIILYAYKQDFWYALIRNLDDPYKGAEFLCTLEAGKNYPYGPPVVKFLTPNGTVKLNDSFCVDMGHYHSDNYPAELGMDGFARQMSLMLVMGMKGLGGGINLLNDKDEEKHVHSANSVSYNLKHNGEYIKYIRRIESMLTDYENCLKYKMETRQKDLEKIFQVSKTTAAEMLDTYDNYLEENPLPSESVLGKTLADYEKEHKKEVEKSKPTKMEVDESESSSVSKTDEDDDADVKSEKSESSESSDHKSKKKSDKKSEKKSEKKSDKKSEKKEKESSKKSDEKSDKKSDKKAKKAKDSESESESSSSSSDSDSEQERRKKKKTKEAKESKKESKVAKAKK